MQPIEQQCKNQLINKVIGISDVSNEISSVYEEKFTDNDEVIYPGAKEAIRIGSSEKVSDEIKDILLSRDNTETHISCVQKAVSSHFSLNKQNMLPIYSKNPTLRMLQQAYQSNSPYYIEMAMVAHNCLYHCGMKPIFKISSVTLRIGNIYVNFFHAYNLFSNQGKYYIFDSSFPVINNLERGFEYTVCEISKEVFDDMKDSSGKTYGVKLMHPKFFDIIPDYELIYDIGKEKIVNPVGETTKKV